MFKGRGKTDESLNTISKVQTTKFLTKPRSANSQYAPSTNSQYAASTNSSVTDVYKRQVQRFNLYVFKERKRNMTN